MYSAWFPSHLSLTIQTAQGKLGVGLDVHRSKFSFDVIFQVTWPKRVPEQQQQHTHKNIERKT